MENKKPEIYCLVGISGSGKSTQAREMVKYLNAVIVSRDAIRNMLFGYEDHTIHMYYQREDLNDRERQVTDLQDSIVKATLQGDISVILDNTHLKMKYINAVKAYGVPVNFIKCAVEIGAAVYRDDMRTRSVGFEVIERQYKDFQNLCSSFDFARYEPGAITPIIQNPDLPMCYVFDIDGTLAINNGRSPFDWKRVGEDSVKDNVDTTQQLMYSHGGFSIFIVSGRDSICRPETEKWLSDNHIYYEKLYMRAQGDARKDSVVKEEFWREIIKENYIVGMFDDRLQVINHARALGFTVFDVASNTF